jgi:hypothetical protein
VGVAASALLYVIASALMAFAPNFGVTVIAAVVYRIRSVR